MHRTSCCGSCYFEDARSVLTLGALSLTKLFQPLVYGVKSQCLIINEKSSVVDGFDGEFPPFFMVNPWYMVNPW